MYKKICHKIVRLVDQEIFIKKIFCSYTVYHFYIYSKVEHMDGYLFFTNDLEPFHDYYTTIGRLANSYYNQNNDIVYNFNITQKFFSSAKLNAASGAASG